MKIIVGLGNPGKKYHLTRHNVGWLALDHFLKNQTIASIKQEFESEICELSHKSGKIFFVKPQTFMNESGRAVGAISHFYKTNPSSDLLVVHDDIDLKFESLKTTSSSGSAGHNGIKSLITHLNTQDFHRLRIGIENRPSKLSPPTEDYVLQTFTQTEQEYLSTHLFTQTDQIIERFILNEPI